MQRLLTFALCLLLCTSLTEAKSRRHPAATIETECGSVAGSLSNTTQVWSYLGIPYASPPVGKLRWQPTVALKDAGLCWKGVLNATQYGAPCLQYFQALMSSPDNAPDGSEWGSEDCLTLNVFVPSPSKSSRFRSKSGPLPVLVSVHGGSSVIGWSGWDEHSALLQRHPNYVVVTFNYRLHAFGYLALEALSAVSPTSTSGNYGLLDGIEVLSWVQRNIAAFGGDPSRVTLYGQSSGGTFTTALLISPLARGLFHRALSLSGSPMISQDRRSTEKLNVAFVQATPCPLFPNNDTLSCLYGLTASQVLAAAPFNTFPFWAGTVPPNNLFDLPIADTVQGGLIVVDGHVIPLPIMEALATADRSLDVPLMLGNVAQEIDFYPGQNLSSVTTQDAWAAWVKKQFLSWGPDFAQRVLQLYPLGPLGAQYTYETMTTDARSLCGNLQLARIAAGNQARRSPVYFFLNTQRPNQPFSFLASEWKQQYSFHMFDLMNFLDALNSFAPTYPIQASDKRHRNLLQDLWLAFVSDGEVPGWPTVGSDLQQYPSVILNDTLSSAPRLREEKCKFWIDNGFVAQYSWNN